ncbi:MAG: SIS domain-containing protein, partial [Pyrinomonadaceae bacterium]
MTDGLIEGHFEANREVVARSAAELRAPAGRVAQALVEALGAGHKVIAFGNGGSAAQASHLAGELL